MYNKYKKPIFLNQLSFPSHDGGAGGADVWNEGPYTAEWFPKTEKYPLDFQEQADAYEAVFQAIYDVRDLVVSSPSGMATGIYKKKLRAYDLSQQKKFGESG